MTSPFARPHNAQPVAALRARFEAALAVSHPFPPKTLGPPPESIFDFDDGVRLIVAREELAPGYARVHASLSSFRPEPIRLRCCPADALKHYWSLLTDRPFAPDEDGVVLSDAGYAHVWMHWEGA